MSTTGLTEKLTLALNSKNAIKSTLVDRAAIEEAAPFTEYAGAIENIGAEMPDIASWIEYELPVTMVDARKYTYDAEHIFIFDTRTDTQGLWCLNTKTQQITQIIDNGCGYSKYYKLDDTHLLIAGSSYESNIILYNLEDDTYELLVSKIAMKNFTEISTGFLAISNNTKYNSYFIDKKTFEVVNLGTNITNWEVAYTDDTHTLLYYSSGGNNPYVIDNNTHEVTQLTGMITTTYKWKTIEIDNNTILLSHGSSSKPSDTTYLGVWEWKKAEKIATKIYNEGWYLDTCANMNNKAILRCSETKQNLLIYDKTTSTIEVLLENVGYSRGCNNLSRIPEGALITHSLNNSNAIYVYNEENNELIQTGQTYSYDFKHYTTDYGVFLGTGNTTAGYYYNNETRTIGGAGCYFSASYTVLETSFGQIIYNCKNGIYVNRYVDGVRNYKVVGDNRQTANHTYSTYAETEDYLYFCGGGNNYSYVVKQHKTNYEDSEVFLNSRSTMYGTIITAGKNVYIYGDNLYVYNEETGEVTTCPANDFIDSERKLVPAYDMVTTNNLKFTDERGIIDPITNTVSTIPFRKYLWKNYTFDNYGVTNINNGQQYQFKYPYGSLSNGWGFIDCNYTNSAKVTVFNNTNIFTAICKNAIIVCNKEV